MLRKLVLLPLAMPLALFVGCEGTAQNDATTTTDSALESCFASSGDGSTKCAVQGGGFSRDPQDVDHDGRPDSFVCAHIIKVPHGWIGGEGGSSGASSPDAARPPVPSVPTDADCGHMGCQDQRPHHGGPGAGNGGAAGKMGPSEPTSGPASGPGASSDAASTDRPAGDDADDMKCPGHGPQGAGGSGAGGPPDHGPGGDGAGGAGAPSGHGQGGPGAGPGDGHGAGGAGAH